jgi:hypothetical protein
MEKKGRGAGQKNNDAKGHEYQCHSWVFPFVNLGILMICRDLMDLSVRNPRG